LNANLWLFLELKNLLRNFDQSDTLPEFDKKFAEPQQYNRPFSTGQLSAFIIQLVLWDIATPQ
jgi:hypothetical protein